ncbi:MAG: phosphatidylinositol kinase [Actinobacteria bacterium]|nr:phosphatidylinositol kinase [Actinomycetota bacterium]
MNATDEFLERLQKQDLVITGRLVDASNATLFGHLLNDEDIKIIYKPVAGERPLWDFPVGSLAGREYCAYLFSEEFGFNLVPTTVLRDGPFGFGMVQTWLDDAQPESLITFSQGDHPHLRKMALFDAVINNADRKYGHILLTKNSQVLGCDHGVTFHHEDKLRTVLWQFAGENLDSTEIYTLENINDFDLGFLEEHITNIEIAAIKKRVHSLLENGVLPLPATDRPSIPWPPI